MKGKRTSEDSKGDRKTFGDILAENKFVLVYFWSKICIMCRLMMPIVDRLSKELKVKTVKVDAGRHHKMTLKYGVRITPTILLFKNGEPIKSFASVHSYGRIKKDVVKAMQNGE